MRRGFRASRGAAKQGRLHTGGIPLSERPMLRRRVPARGEAHPWPLRAGRMASPRCESTAGRGIGTAWATASTARRELGRRGGCRLPCLVSGETRRPRTACARRARRRDPHRATAAKRWHAHRPDSVPVHRDCVARSCRGVAACHSSRVRSAASEGVLAQSCLSRSTRCKPLRGCITLIDARRLLAPGSASGRGAPRRGIVHGMRAVRCVC